MHIRTNWHRREIVSEFQLTEKEREQFDYLDWHAMDDGRDSASFFRYRGELYDLGQFMRTDAPGTPVAAWDGYMSDSYFSGTLVKFVSEDCDDYIIVASYYS